MVRTPNWHQSFAQCIGMRLNDKPDFFNSTCFQRVRLHQRTPDLMKEKCTLDDVISNRDKSDSFTRTSSLTHGYLGAALPDPQIHFYFELEIVDRSSQESKSTSESYV